MEKTITVSLETLLKIETALNAASTFVPKENEINDLISESSTTVGEIITKNFTEFEISEAQDD